MTSEPNYEREIVGPVGLGGAGYAFAQEQATFAFVADGHQGFRIGDVIVANDGTRWRIIEAKLVMSLIHYRGVRDSA